MGKELKGRRIAVLATDGFEKVELTIPVAVLRSAGAQVDVVSLHHGSIRGVNLHKPANKVHVTKTVSEANPANYDAVLVPGGFINPDMLRHGGNHRHLDLHLVLGQQLEIPPCLPLLKDQRLRDHF